MNRNPSPWALLIMLALLILGLSSTDCDGNCPAPQESRQ